MSRGRTWFEALAGAPRRRARVRAVLTGPWASERVSGGRPRSGGEVPPGAWRRAWPRRGLGPRPARARSGEDGDRRALVAVVDVPGQPYGYREELLGLHLALAAAVDAYATARLAGHPVVALVVGQAISGAFLAHGMQANRILALEDPGVAVQVMSKRSTARVTRRSVEELDEIAEEVPATAYDVASFARLGALHRLIDGVDAAEPDCGGRRDGARRARRGDLSARHDGSTDLSGRLDSPEARQHRARACESGSGSPRSGAGEAARHATSGPRHRAAPRGVRPAWVPESLARAPGSLCAAHVRRLGSSPSGCGGAPAGERFAALLAPDAVAARVTPEDLAAARCWRHVPARVGWALCVSWTRSTSCVHPRPRLGPDRQRRLRAGHRRSSAGVASDLDVVVRAPEPWPLENAREIADHLNRLPAASTRNSTCRPGLWRWTSTPAAGGSCCARLTAAADPRPVARSPDRSAERMSVAFLFPGQGSQRPGMLHDLPEHPVARDMISHATGVLGRDVLDLDTPRLSARPSPLSSRCSSPAPPLPGYWSRKAAAGLRGGPLGRRVRCRRGGRRARLPGRAAPGRPARSCKKRTRTATAWASSSGWTSGPSPVSPRIRHPEAPVHAANVNAPLQVGVAGADTPWSGFWTSLASTAPAAPAPRRAHPFAHAPHGPGRGEAREGLADVPMNPPAVPYLSNVGGRALRDPEEIRDDLAERRTAGPLARRHHLALRARCPAVRRAAARPRAHRSGDSAFPEARAVAVADAGGDSAVTLIARHRSERGALR